MEGGGRCTHASMMRVLVRGVPGGAVANRRHVKVAVRGVSGTAPVGRQQHRSTKASTRLAPLGSTRRAGSGCCSRSVYVRRLRFVAIALVYVAYFARVRVHVSVVHSVLLKLSQADKPPSPHPTPTPPPPTTTTTHTRVPSSPSTWKGNPFFPYRAGSGCTHQTSRLCRLQGAERIITYSSPSALAPPSVVLANVLANPNVPTLPSLPLTARLTP